jgi:hypothetical protein
MSGLSLHAIAALTRAGLLPMLMLTILVFASGSSVAASANEACSVGYKVCNSGCNRSINAAGEVWACKSRCDFRLIVCDRLPTAAAQGESYSSPPSRRVNDGSDPVASSDGTH